MDISVVIPTFNRAWCLKRALDSVAAQVLIPCEVIIVNDGSVDETSALLCDLGAIPYRFALQIINLPTSRGVSAARNVGISAARCPWIALLDSDDEWLRNRLSAQCELIHKQEFCLVHGEEIWIRNGIRVNPKLKHRKSGGMIFNRCLDMCRISPSAALLKKTLWEELEGFREDFPVCEDYDFWLRATCKYEVGFVENPIIVKYGGHADQLSQRFVAMDRWRIRSLLELLKDPSLSKQQEEDVRSTISQKAKVLLAGLQRHGRQHEAEKLLLELQSSDLSIA